MDILKMLQALLGLEIAKASEDDTDPSEEELMADIDSMIPDYTYRGTPTINYKYVY